jgi:uroporphyrinogen-III synthase
LNNIYLFSKTSHSEVTHIPILDTKFLQPTIDFSQYDAIVLTSKQAVTALDMISPAWKMIPSLTIADKTAAMVEASGGILLDKGDGYGDSLDSIIKNKYSSYKWLYPRPKVVASNFSERVRDLGVSMDEVIIYETSCNSACSSHIIPEDAILIFTSPFTIECFLKMFIFKPTYKVIAIGRTTASALPKDVDYVMPETPNVDACVSLAKKTLFANKR